MGFKYKLSILGGTFDRFHIGHKQLLADAFKNSEKVIIGVATKNIYKDKHMPDVIEDLQTRKNSLIVYLKDNRLTERSEVIEINDIYGNSLEVSEIQAIFVTEENLKNVGRITTKRSELGLKKLDVVIVPQVMGDDQQVISSERIRNGEIDRLGTSYYNLFTKKKRYSLPQDLRQELRVPIGKVYRRIADLLEVFEKSPLIVSIGDIVSVGLFECGHQSDVSVFDFKTKREKITEKDREVLLKLSENIELVNNMPANIERRAVGALKRAIEKYQKNHEKQAILIEGEEDLLTIPAILLSPLESIVVYGLRDKGIVAVRVTEKKKKEVRYLLNKMS